MGPDDFEETDECWQCNGDGNIAGCFEDCCSCMGDPDDPDECCAPRRCDVCKGKGHIPVNEEAPTNG